MVSLSLMSNAMVFNDGIINDPSNLNFTHDFKIQYPPGEGRNIETGHTKYNRFLPISKFIFLWA